MLNLCLVKLAFAQGIIHSVSSTYTFIFPELRFLVSQKHQIHDKMAMPDREIFSVYPQWWYFKQYVWCNPNYMTHSFKTETRVFQHVHQFDASVWSVLEILSNMTLWMHKKAKRKNKQKKNYAPFMTAAEYKPLCWYFSYECDRCYVIINVQPRKMVSVVWGTLYVRWNKTLSVRLFQQITSERGGMCNKLGQWTIHAPDSVLL